MMSLMRMYLALGIVVLSLAGCPHTPTPTPDVIDPLPDPAVVHIAELSEPHLADFYFAFADVVERDTASHTPVIKTTGHLRTAYVRAGTLAFQGTEVSHPELAIQIDKIMADWIGLDNVPLSAEKRASIVACFRAIGQALQ